MFENIFKKSEIFLVKRVDLKKLFVKVKNFFGEREYTKSYNLTKKFILMKLILFNFITFLVIFFFFIFLNILLNTIEFRKKLYYNFNPMLFLCKERWVSG